MMDDYNTLIRTSEQLNNDLDDWIAANAIAGVFSPLYDLVDNQVN